MAPAAHTTTHMIVVQNPTTSSELDTTSLAAHYTYRPVFQVSKPGKISTKHQRDEAIPRILARVENCKNDVRNAFESEALNVVGVMGMGQYNKSIQPQLP